MTKRELEAVHEELVSIVDGWNDAAADEDRGRANDALCLTLYDDGSGRVGRRLWYENSRVEDFYGFNNLDDLLKALVDNENTEVDDPITPETLDQLASDARQLRNEEYEDNDSATAKVWARLLDLEYSAGALATAMREYNKEKR